MIERRNNSKSVAIVSRHSIFCKMRSEIMMNESLLEGVTTAVSLVLQ